MMFIHELADVRQLFLIIGEEKNIDPYLVEKDYWIMHALWGLQQQGFQFELKGGTSLSKGFKIIDRFSEDIDIKIEPEISELVKTGKNHDKPKDIESRRSFFDSLTRKLAIPGMFAQRALEYDDSKMRNGGINLNYHSFFDIPEKIKPSILLEVGFDNTTPNEQVTIDSWAYRKAIDSGIEITDNRAKNIKCYYPEYTFVEKLQTISTKVRKQLETNEFGPNFLRHFYDIHMLYQQDRIRNFIGTPAFIEHKKHRFRQQDNLDLKNNFAFNLDGDQEIFKRYEQEYLKIASLFISGSPSFKEIYRSIIDIREIVEPSVIEENI